MVQSVSIQLVLANKASHKKDNATYKKQYTLKLKRLIQTGSPRFSLLLADVGPERSQCVAKPNHTKFTRDIKTIKQHHFLADENSDDALKFLVMLQTMPIEL